MHSIVKLLLCFHMLGIGIGTADYVVYAVHHGMCAIYVSCDRCEDVTPSSIIMVQLFGFLYLFRFEMKQAALSCAMSMSCRWHLGWPLCSVICPLRFCPCKA